tara:strand:+ start:858 stop:1238 length:381 start_codon:yes stop_codon:yes gene_type:complete
VGVRKSLTISALGIAAIAALAVLTWPAAPFALAALTAEKPPELLLDFAYPEDMESHAFGARFKEGTSESALIDWLRYNGFEMADNSSASRHYAGMPCSYHYRIEWQSEDGALRRDAVAHVEGYGCL